MTQEYKTTKKDFELFVRECKKWIDYFGLKDSEFFFAHEDIKEIGEACCYYPDYPEYTNFTLVLATMQADSVTAYHIKKCAFHEVMEAMLYKMKYLAKSRFVNESEIREENHRIIRRFENSVFEDSVNRSKK